MPKAKKPITCCPHCGSTEGIYTKCDYMGVRYNIGFGGEEQYNGEMFDGCESIEGGRIAYCQMCNKPSGKLWGWSFERQGPGTERRMRRVRCGAPREEPPQRANAVPPVPKPAVQARQDGTAAPEQYPEQPGYRWCRRPGQGGPHELWAVRGREERGVEPWLE